MDNIQQTEVEEAQPEFTDEQRTRIYETWMARYTDWILEIQGEPIVLLNDPEYADMFWTNYRLVPLTQDPTIRSELYNKEFWFNGEGFTFRSREFGVVTALGFGHLIPETEQVCMRGLFIDTEPPPQLREEPNLFWDSLDKLSGPTFIFVILCAAIISIWIHEQTGWNLSLVMYVGLIPAVIISYFVDGPLFKIWSQVCNIASMIRRHPHKKEDDS